MSLLKNTKHKLEAFALRALLFIFKSMPIDAASCIGGALGRFIGGFMSANKTALKNIADVFPEKSETERKEIIRKMWDNLGRTAAELPHLRGEEIAKRIKIIGAENLPAIGKPAFLFSGHIGNWELLSFVSWLHNRPITAVYREANNKLVDDIITKIRAVRYCNLIPKGRSGAVKIARAIKNNEAIAMLVDQKMNDGISVPFLGREAMTAPAIATLALRYEATITPARIIRTGGANFEAIIYPPLEFKKTGDIDHDSKTIMITINGVLESWIRERPEQWFWVHKRWPKE
jgi:KDO2-lipid IV(A) lauroyltransferase